MKDYKNMVCRLRKNSNSQELLNDIAEIKRFFLGDRLLIFTKMNGEYLLEIANRQVEEKLKKKIKKKIKETKENEKI